MLATPLYHTHVPRMLAVPLIPHVPLTPPPPPPPPPTQAQKTERHVFLLDGLAVCCKGKSRGGVGEYRFKEKINMRKAELVDLDDVDGEWYKVM